MLSAVDIEESSARFMQPEKTFTADLSFPSLESSLFFNRLSASEAALMSAMKRGTNLSVIDKRSPSIGNIRPNSHTNLSEVMTLLNAENQHTTAERVRADESPQMIDSSVSGFPLGKYASIVAPSCEKSGFISAVNAIIGMSAARLKLFGDMLFEYSIPVISEISEMSGCVTMLVIPMTNVKKTNSTAG